MNLRQSLAVTGISLVCATVLAGCGPANNTVSTAINTSSLSTSSNTGAQQSTPHNPPFENKLKQDIMAPDTKFDASPVGNDYSDIQVTASNGRTVKLNAATQSVLFEAYWCPHCQRTLVLWNQNRSKLRQFPVIVSTGFAPGTTLSQAKSLGNQELNALHIKNAKVYYLLNTQEFRKLVYTFPTFAFPYHNKVELLTGEHSFSIWERAIDET